MKKLLIAAVLALAACTDDRPAITPSVPPAVADCPVGTTSPDCVWPDGQPK